MTSLLRSYELLYIETAKLTYEYLHSDPLKPTYNADLLFVLQTKFFTLLGNAPGSLYLTESYLNSPQSSFVNDELAKISILATNLGITNESFSVYGPQATINGINGMSPTIPQLSYASVANIDYIYSNDFALQYSYSIRLPYIVDGSTTNLQNDIRIGVRTNYMNDPLADLVFLRVHRVIIDTSYFQYYYMYTLFSRTNGITSTIAQSPKILISVGNDHIITICNDSNGISFLINGYDYFGHITSSMTLFDITKPMIFYTTPAATLYSDTLIYPTGYTLNTTSIIGTFIKNSDHITLSPQTKISQSGVTAAFSGLSVQNDFIAYSISSKAVTYYIDLINVIDGIYFGLSTNIFAGGIYVSISITSSVIEVYTSGIFSSSFPLIPFLDTSEFNNGNGANGVMIIQNSSGVQFLIDGVDYFGILDLYEPTYCFAGNQNTGEISNNTYENTIKVYVQDNSPFFTPELTYSSSSVGVYPSLDITFNQGAKINIDYAVGTTPLMRGKYTITLASAGSGSFVDRLAIGLRSDPFTNNTRTPRIQIYVTIQQIVFDEELFTKFILYTDNGTSESNLGEVSINDPLSYNTLSILQDSEGIDFSIDGSSIGRLFYSPDYGCNFNQPLYFYATPGQTWLDGGGIDQGMPNGDPMITLTNITLP